MPISRQKKVSNFSANIILVTTFIFEKFRHCLIVLYIKKYYLQVF